jgi:hypothetical protein
MSPVGTRLRDQFRERKTLMPKPKPPRPIARKPVYTPAGLRTPQQPSAARAAMRTLGPLGVMAGMWGGKQRGRSRR